MMINQNSSAEYFFYQTINSAQSSTGIKLPPDLEFYLVKLLSSHINPSIDLSNACLFDLLEAAHHSNGPDSIPAWKTLGDASIIAISFNGKIRRKVISESYCLTLGSQGYLEASYAATSHKRPFSVRCLYARLGNRIQECSEIAKTALEAFLSPPIM
jgi:hypothetical protein